MMAYWDEEFDWEPDSPDFEFEFEEWDPPTEDEERVFDSRPDAADLVDW